MKTSDDGYVGFVPETHQYFDTDGREYRSATTELGRRFPFDADAVAKKVSDDPRSIFFGMSVESIKAKWAATGPEGTELHESIEHWINTGEILKNGHEYSVGRFAESAKSRFCSSKLRSEIILYDSRLLLAGTADLLEFRKDVIAVWDIKTSRRIDQHKLLKYSMQLELYRIWAEQIYDKPAIVEGIVWFRNYIENRRCDPVILRPMRCVEDIEALEEERRDELLLAS